MARAGGSSSALFAIDDTTLSARTGTEEELLDLASGPPARTLVDIFLASMALWPGHVALDDGSRRRTYRQLYNDARRLARRLEAAGIARGDRVGIRVPSGTADLYIAVLGTLLAGAVYVPVDFADPDARAELVWRDANVSAVVGQRLAVSRRRPGRSLKGRLRPVDDCWLIFTSGSTGAPKGVAVSHRAAAASSTPRPSCGTSALTTGCWLGCRSGSTPAVKRYGWRGATAPPSCPAPDRSCSREWISGPGWSSGASPLSRPSPPWQRCGTTRSFPAYAC